MTKHTVRVTFERDDRDDPIDAGAHTFYGEDYEAFDDAAARAALVNEGLLEIGPDLVTFGGTIVPTAKLDRIRVEIAAKSITPD